MYFIFNRFDIQMKRKKVQTETETKILTESRRICCICFGLKNDIRVKKGQIAHLDKDNTNSNEGNLAFLCFVHHDKYDSITRQSKNFTIQEVKIYKTQLLEYTSELTKAQKNLAKDNHFIKRKGPIIKKNSDENKITVMNVAVYGCFNIGIDKKLTINSISEEVNHVMHNSIKSANSKIYSFKNSILLHYVHIPEGLLPKWGYTTLNEVIKQNNYFAPHLATIHFYNNESEQKLHAIINYNEDALLNSAPGERAQKLINKLLSANCLTRNELIDICLNIFYLVYSQVHLDILLEDKEYKKLYYTLDGCEKLALEIKTSCDFLPATQKSEVDEFLKFWLSHCERYRAIGLNKEAEYEGAVSSIIKAISLNPFYPYPNYSSLKENYTKRYAVELAPKLNEMQELFEDIDVTADENLKVAEELSNQIEFKETSYHYEILKHIMYNNQDNKDLIEYIEEEMRKLEDTSPFILITKSEIIRFLKKGTKRVNDIYAERMDDTIEYLKRALVLDPDFPVIYTKVGSLLLMKSVHMSDSSASEEFVKMYKKGGHFLAQLGFRMRALTK
jgi:tetratricopeptide (TPR) repeat protein